MKQRSGQHPVLSPLIERSFDEACTLPDIQSPDHHPFTTTRFWDVLVDSALSWQLEPYEHTKIKPRHCDIVAITSLNLALLPAPRPRIVHEDAISGPSSQHRPTKRKLKNLGLSSGLPWRHLTGTYDYVRVLGFALNIVRAHLQLSLRESSPGRNTKPTWSSLSSRVSISVAAKRLRR